jgi:hypothetical protein
VGIYSELDKFKPAGGAPGVRVTNELLEAYERPGPVYPLYRIRRPADCLRTIFEQKFGTGSDEDGTCISRCYSWYFIHGNHDEQFRLQRHAAQCGGSRLKVSQKEVSSGVWNPAPYDFNGMLMLHALIKIVRVDLLYRV